MAADEAQHPFLLLRSVQCLPLAPKQDCGPPGHGLECCDCHFEQKRSTVTCESLGRVGASKHERRRMWHAWMATHSFSDAWEWR